MSKINATVMRETKYIAAFSAVLSVLMQAVFLIVLRRFDYTVMLGNILGYIAAVGNFLLMGIGVQKAVERDQKGAKGVLKFSQAFRFLGIFVIVAAGTVLDVFNTVAVIAPLFFPQIAIAARQFKKK
ncbi:MAG: hypothetical protein IK086_00940 [Clostridia bacterium]|nr:hypothetical protein [Clostridia bacterium]